MRTLIDAPEPDRAFASVHDHTWHIEVTANRDRVEQLYRCPELRLLGRNIVVRTNPTLESPFRVPNASTIELRANAAVSAEALRVYLRHALEIALWHRISRSNPDPALQIASAALASITALRYLDCLPVGDRDAAIAADPGWFSSLEVMFGFRREPPGNVGAAAEFIAQRIDRLLPVQGAPVFEAISAGLIAKSAAVIEQLLPLAAPTEQLLAWGGDGRLAVDPRSRLNKYGCSTVPRPTALTFSSCTASSTSELGYRSAEIARAWLIEETVRKGSYHDACATLMDQTRQEVANVVGLDAGRDAEIVLAASATDCELFALYVALASHTRELLTIVIGPDEIGSGSLPAASGYHFDTVTPLKKAVEVGKPVEGLPVWRVRVETISLRDDSGAVIALSEIDATVERLARAAVAAGSYVLLHVVDGSKTGLSAPSLTCVKRLQQELGDRLIVLVDAAQTRRRLGKLKAYVCDGSIVMISGSKFFTGAPFSGALIVPPRHFATLETVRQMPDGFGAYLSSLEVPTRWTTVRAGLPQTPNLGLLMRWRTALAEMQAFQEVGEDLKNAWYSEFREAVVQACGKYHLPLVDSPVGERTLDTTHAWDRWPTIFTFFVWIASGHGQRTLGTYEQASQIYLALNRDVSGELPTCLVSLSTLRSGAMRRRASCRSFEISTARYTRSPCLRTIGPT
jgi:hypothetical protein